jgi:hypothetical protein
MGGRASKLKNVASSTTKSALERNPISPSSGTSRLSPEPSSVPTSPPRDSGGEASHPEMNPEILEQIKKWQVSKVNPFVSICCLVFLMLICFWFSVVGSHASW